MSQAVEAGSSRYPKVFEPLRLGPVEVPNRIYMAPHGLPLDVPIRGLESHGEPSAEHAHYFAERAAGGTGLIFHSTLLGPFGDIANYIHATPGLSEAIPSYRGVADLVHAEGAKIMAQIWYLPWVSHKWDALGPSAPSLAPSNTPFYYPTLPGSMYAMRKHDIAHVVDAHRIATANLRTARYDGVEVHLSHGSVLEYFLSGYHNHREDEYGGSLENRCRIVREALEVTREAAGPDMAVGVRMNADQMLPGGFGEEGAEAILTHLVATGLLDFVDLDISVEPEQAYLTTSSYMEREHHNADRVRRVGPAASPLPLLSTPGRVTSIADAERLLAEGVVDMVGVVRGLIAEPQLVNQARAGHEHHSRICIGANHCFGNNASGEGWGCAINAAAGREERWGFRSGRPAAQAMRVVIVGAGPAGFEAARTAAERGHRVTLLEREPAIGGALNLWGRLPGREGVLSFAEWASRRLEELGVELQTGVAGTAEAIAGLAPDVVFVATGALYDRTGQGGTAPAPISGWDNDFVHTPEAVIRGDVRLSGRVVVLDDEGFHTAVGVAEMAGAAGAEVEFVTRMPVPAMNLPSDLPYVWPRLQTAGVAVSTLTCIKAIEPGRVTLAHVMSQEERVIEAVDAVVLATLRKPLDALADELEGVVPAVYLVGDALAPRSLREATYEGHRFARLVGEAGMPVHTTDALFQPLNALRPAAQA